MKNESKLSPLLFQKLVQHLFALNLQDSLFKFAILVFIIEYAFTA